MTRTNTLLDACKTVAKKRGLRHLASFIIHDLLGNQLGLPINGHRKELLFWEKQAIGIGDFSSNFLRKIDPKQQQNIFPNEIMTFIQKQINIAERKPIDVLDVGAGPVSLLTWAHTQGLIKLVASDILSNDYKRLLIDYGFIDAMRGISMQECKAEDLSTNFSHNFFNIVYSNNALDHTDSPQHSLYNMVDVTRPKGYIMISGRSREGTQENWDGIHNHDLYLENGQLFRSGKSGDSICLSDGLPIQPIYTNNPKGPFDYMCIVYQKEVH